jgi:hypothetical protein
VGAKIAPSEVKDKIREPEAKNSDGPLFHTNLSFMAPIQAFLKYHFSLA